MKSAILLFSMVLLFASSAFSQDMQYVASQSGDTLVVKDDIAFGGTNTLYLLMASDSLAPASRVYELTGGGIYSIVNNPVTSANNRTIIMGPTQTSLKVSKGSAPPILSGSYATGVNTTGGINVNKDLLIKNCDVEIANSGGGIGWGFFNFNGPSMRIQIDNCIIEHNWWTVIGGPPANESMFFTNDYMVNLDGHTCRRNGGVLDFFTNEDTIFVENCTHVNVQGSLYKSRPTYLINRILINHNDFVDCSGFVLMNSGADHANYSVTNNIFVNVHLQGYCPVLSGSDVGEVDPDSLPMGLVNVKSDSLFQATGASFYADKNLAYWDPSLSDIASTLNTNKVNGATNWVSQMIPMNSRTAALFNNDATYPKLISRGWIVNTKPTFKTPDVLFTTQLAVVKAYAIAAVDTSYGTPLKSWRQAGNPEATNFIYADWPIPIDLSYSDAGLLKAGLSGFPVGDLDWFPTQYATWSAQASAEHNTIQGILDNGDKVGAVHGQQQLAQKFELGQNYPNPFNPTTRISYTIAKAGNVTLKVYNMLGQEVSTLVNGYQVANSYNIDFNASSLASGVYIYELRSGSDVISKKMVLMK